MRLPVLLASVSFVVACGENAPDAPDASTLDAAPAPDATPSIATVTAIDDSGAPVMGATLLVHDRDGHFQRRAVTSALGEAELPVIAGEQVTLITHRGEKSLVTTITDVQPRDHLRFGLRTAVAFHAYPATVPSHPTAVRTRLLTSCSENYRAPGVFEFFAYCPTDTVQFVAVPLISTSQLLGQYHVTAAQTATAVTLPDTLEPLATLPVRVDGLDATIAPALPTFPDARIPLRISTVADRNAELPLAGVGNGVAIRVVDSTRRRRLVTRFETTPGALAIDFTLRREITDATIDGRRVSWSIAGHDLTDGVVVTMATPDVEWRVVLAAADTIWSVPELPAELANLEPPGDGSVVPAVAGYNLTWADGWADFRQSAHAETVALEQVVGLRRATSSALVFTSEPQPEGEPPF
jgi:hypothetical protein